MKTKLLLLHAVAGAPLIFLSPSFADLEVQPAADLNARAGPGPQYPSSALPMPDKAQRCAATLKVVKDAVLLIPAAMAGSILIIVSATSAARRSCFLGARLVPA